MDVTALWSPTHPCDAPRISDSAAISFFTHSSETERQAERRTCPGILLQWWSRYRRNASQQCAIGRSGAIHRIWALLHALLAVAWWLGLPAAAADPTCSISSLQSLVQAFLKSSCVTIQIEGDGLELSHAAWIDAMRSIPQQRLLVSRDVTLRGGSHDTRFNCGYLKSRIAIGANVTFSVTNLVILNCLQPSAPLVGGLDVFALNTGSQLVIVNSTVQQPVCVPMDMMLDMTLATPRPPAVPGAQVVQRVPAVCLSSTNCWSEALLLSDFAQNGTTIQPTGIRVSRGLAHYINTLLVCSGKVSADCTGSGTASDLSACVTAAVVSANLSIWDTYDLPNAALVKAMRVEEKNTEVLLAFIVPTVFVGTGLLLITLGLLLWSRQRKKFSPCPKAVKEAYEGVVFVGLAEGSDEPSQPPTVAEGMTMTATVIGVQAKGSRPSPPSSDGHDLDQHGHTTPSTHRRVTTARSLGVGSCATSNSAPPIVGITMASASESGSGGGSPPPEPTLAIPPLMPRAIYLAPPQELAVIAAAARASPQEQKPADEHTATVPATVMAAPSAIPTVSNRKAYSGTPGSASVLAAAAQSTSSRDAAAVQRLLDSGPLNPGVSLNLVLGVDVMLSGPQVVPSRTSFGVTTRGWYGNQHVAVRLFHRDTLGGSYEALQALKQDIEALSRHQHPNIVAMLGAGEAQGGDEVFILEEPMASSVSRLCYDGRSLPMDRVLSIALDVALALSYLHPSVMHSNLRPCSVLLDSSGTAKLTGFGLRRPPDIAGLDLGAAPYLAPECFVRSKRGGAVTAKVVATPESDMYSFGVLLWEMLAHDLPWRGFNIVQIALEHSYGRRLEMPANSRFPSHIRRLILQCLDKEPTKRPTAAEVAKRLSSMIQQPSRPREQV